MSQRDYAKPGNTSTRCITFGDIPASHCSGNCVFVRMLPYPLLFRLQVVTIMRNVPMLRLKFPLEAERIREVFCLAINSGHSVNAELSYELQHSE